MQDPPPQVCFQNQPQQRVVVFENQRLDPDSLRWSVKHLRPTDPLRFLHHGGQSATFPVLTLPQYWDFSGLWDVDLQYPVDMQIRMQGQGIEGMGGMGMDQGQGQGRGQGMEQGQGQGHGAFLGISASGEVQVGGDPDGPSEW
ncbi:hypothetical protein B484DRAFT_425492, partial [Ochromonadaceae sp. CCMP2298]